MKTMTARKADLTRTWFLVNAENKVLGRLASEVATVLRGKHKPIFTPHVDVGDHVVVINAEKIRLTGNKLTDKNYYRHSDYPHGFKSTTAGTLMRERPDRVVQWAIQGMLPKNKLGKAMGKKLRVYRGPDHPHQAQQLTPMSVSEKRRVG